MGRSHAEGGPIAIVGAATEIGARLREALAESSVPGARVDLYGTAPGDPTLSEYDGEARMIQPLDLAEIGRHALVFVCADQDGLRAALAAAVPPEATVIDLAGCPPDGAQGQPDRGWHAVAHPLALLLEEILRPVEAAFGVDEASAVVIRPASDFGQPGVDELREQTLGLLNFSEWPSEAFGRQLAFNLIPQHALAAVDPATESRVVREVSAGLGWSRPRLALKFVVGPLFYGHGIQLRLRLGGTPTLEQVKAAFAGAGLLAGDADEGPTTPLDVAGEPRIGLGDVSEDGLGAFWIWGVAGEAGARAVRQAVRLATQLGRL